MSELPIPPLNHTLDGYLEAVRPLLSDEQFAATERTVESFREDEGPDLQEELVLCGDQQIRGGSSWVSHLWFDAYMRERRPLQLATNVAFQLDWPTDEAGLAGAAQFAANLIAVHLDYLKGNFHGDFDSRGNRLSSTQWTFLAGGVRRPRRKRDNYGKPTSCLSNRKILVLRNGYGFFVEASDMHGLAHSPDAVAAAFESVVAETPDKPGDFTAVSHLAPREAFEVLKELEKHPSNDWLFSEIQDAFFVLDLADQPNGGGAASALSNLAFGTGSVFALKTASYQFGLNDGFVGVNLEHSSVDGATLKLLMDRVQTVETEFSAEAAPAPRPAMWRMTKETRAQVREGVKRFTEATSQLHVDLVEVPFDPSTDIRFSMDAAMQWVLLYASLETWGRVRSTYEAVDMRHFHAGRTESFRPHTQQAITFVEALRNGDATEEQFQDAAAAHSQQVRAAKSGEGIERHLFGLQEMARSSGVKSDLFTDDGYRALTENFLSTTSLGDQTGVVRFAFAPVAEDGLGVNYTRVADGFEYLLTYNLAAQGDDGAQKIEQFKDSLEQGAQALASFLDSL